jgi:hypothetical protein
MTKVLEESNMSVSGVGNPFWFITSFGFSDALGRPLYDAC